MDDESVPHALAVHAKRLENRADALEVQLRNGERNLHVQDVAERAQTGIEEDVANLGDHLAR